MAKLNLSNIKVKSFVTGVTERKVKGGCPIHTDVNCAPSNGCTTKPCYISAGHPVCY